MNEHRNRVRNLMHPRYKCWKENCSAYEYCRTTNMSCEETRLQMLKNRCETVSLPTDTESEGDE